MCGIDTQEKKIAISFDCAWGVDYTDKLLEIMDKNDVRCTFFAVQFWVEKYPEYAKKIVEAGHELGTHSRTHPYMSKLTKSQIQDELFTSSQAIERITGQKVKLFRPPYGDYNDSVVATVRDCGMYTIQWDVDSLDWKDPAPADITSRVLKRVQPGSIILFHNAAKNTPSALPSVIEGLIQQGYTMVPVSQLILRDNYSMDHTGRQIPGTAS